MNCVACTYARQHKDSGMYHAGCDGCAARALARSPMYYEAAQADAMTPAYREALRRAFGERWRDGHQLVKGWVQ